MTRFFFPFYFCVAIIVRLQAAPNAADPAVWPDRGPYRTVGGPEYETVKLPVQVIEAVQHTIPDDPSRWEVSRMRNLSGHGKRLAIGGRRSGLELLLVRGVWVNLCAPGGVPFLNDALGPLRPADLQNEDKVERYLSTAIYVHYGRDYILSKYFQNRFLARNPNKLWFDHETRPAALFALCYDPVVTRDKDRVTIYCNVLTPAGSVDRRTFHFGMDKELRLESIDSTELRKKRTFGYLPTF